MSVSDDRFNAGVQRCLQEVDRKLDYGYREETAIDIADFCSLQDFEACRDDVCQALGFLDEPELTFRTEADRKWAGYRSAHSRIYYQTVGRLLRLRTLTGFSYEQRIYSTPDNSHLALIEFRGLSRRLTPGRLCRSQVHTFSDDAFVQRSTSGARRAIPGSGLKDWLSRDAWQNFDGK
jgi:hypothetical protein